MQSTIMIVEDNEPNLELMSFLLTTFGYSVVKARDGVEGWELLNQQAPDVILCDLEMPRLNGYELTKKIKAEETFSLVPVVAVTAYAMVGDREKVMATGFDGYLTKPIDPQRFVQQVEAFLPVYKRMQQPERKSFPMAVPEKHQMAEKKLATILVVDDSMSNLKLLESLLEPSGYTVLRAMSANEGFEVALETMPDLIICDTVMPEQSGHDLLLMVKRDARLNPIPFALITSAHLKQFLLIEKFALDNGATMCLQRPIEPQFLLDKIKACLATGAFKKIQ